MRSSIIRGFLALAPIVLAGCGDSTSDGSASEPPELAGILQAHNDERALVGVEPLVWDQALSAIAQNWADACVDDAQPAGLIDHNPNRGDGYDGSVGENIYGSSGNVDGPSAVAAWASEKADYDYASNGCSGVCGHFTQVVWSETTKVGCALGNCAGLTYPNVVVCNYSPAGNSGGKPY